jgi:type I restriction enzyme M protein
MGSCGGFRPGNSVSPLDLTSDRLWRSASSIEEVVTGWPRPKDHVLPILFLRFLSDWREETLAGYRRKYKGDAVRVDRAMRRERFVIPDECTFDHLYARRTLEDLGERINTMLRTIEQANLSKLGGVFSNTDFNSLGLGDTSERNARLRNLLETFTELDIDTTRTPVTEWLKALADLLTSHFAEGAARRREPYYTPPEVSELMTRLVEPAPGDRIYDPSCGSGGLLVHAARAIENENFALFGHESEHSKWSLCRLNLMLHGMDSARITKGSPIRKPILTDDETLQKFDVILTDPPFSPAEWDADDIKYDRFNRFKRGVPPKGSGDYALIAHVIETLDPVHGRACIVAPLGTLFRGGSEGLIRTRLIEEGLLEGVVRLPANLFFGTSIPVALLLFRATRPDKSVFFIDASREFGGEKNRNRLREDDIEKIVITWQSRAEQAEYSRLVPYEEIEANEFNLNVRLYVKAADEGTMDLEAVTAEVRRLEQQLAQARTNLTSALNKLRE